MCIRDRDDHTQQPIVRGDDIWIVQEDAGQVRLLTNGRERGRLRLGAGLLPLIDAGAHLYTAYQEDEDDMGVVVQIDPDARTERRVRVSGDVYSITPIAGNIWVSHGRPADIGRQDAGNLTIFSESTLLEVRSPARVGIFAGKPVHVDNAVWVTGGSITRGTVFAFDAATAQPIGEPLTFPDTPFGAWSPLAIDDSLWFTASAPNLGGIFPILANETTPVQVYALDPVTRTWREDSAFTLPDLVGAPQWDGHYLWYGLQGFGVVTPRQHLINSSGVLAFDLAARTIAGRWSPCQSLTDFSLIGHWVIAGCLNASDDLLLLIDRRDVMLTARTISDVGVNPNPPLLHEGMIWVTFKDTDSAVVLDAETGAVRARYSVGRSPQTPVVYRGAVWVVNSGDGTMQRLSVPESAH
jgi:outer membrane protein assembly factor BamB